MKKRSRLLLVVLAVVMAMVLSSCWQIRRVGVNKWQINNSETSTVTLDLGKYTTGSTYEGYPFVLVGFTDNLRNAGKKWDVKGVFGGPETGIKDAGLKLEMLGASTLCTVGSASLNEVAGGYPNWVAFRTSFTIDQGAMADDDLLRFKHTLGVASGATIPSLGSFIYISGIWVDDGDLVVETGEAICQSTYNGNLDIVAP